MSLISSFRSRASLSSVRSGTSPDSATEITGCSAMLTSCTDGGLASCGSSERASSTLARTSSSAFVLLKLTSNSRMTTTAKPL